MPTTNYNLPTISPSDIADVPRDMNALANATDTAIRTATQSSVSDRAPINSPTFTGIPTAPTADVTTNSSQIATTSYVKSNVGPITQLSTDNKTNTVASINELNSNKAPKISPAFTGIPTAPTPVAGTSNNQIATTSFVDLRLEKRKLLPVGYNLDNAKVDGIFSGYQPVNSPVASNVYVLDVEAYSSDWVLQRFSYLRTDGATATYQRIYYDGNAWSPWQNIPSANSPAFTGVPTAPTADVTTNSSQIATTSFVKSNVGPITQLSTTNKTNTVAAINELNVIKLSTRTTLASGTNLNNIRTDGLYTGSNLTNAPLLSIATLEVKVYSSDWIVQSITHIPGTGIFRAFERVYYNGNTWSAWRETAATGDLTSLQTTEKTNLVGAINELFTSVSNGKNAIASAITSFGVEAHGSDTFGQLSQQINSIPRQASGFVNVSSDLLSFSRVYPTVSVANRRYITVSGLNFTPSVIIISGPTERYTVEFNGAHRLENRSILMYGSVDMREVVSNNVSSSYVNATGFRLPVPNDSVAGESVRWQAYA